MSINIVSWDKLQSFVFSLPDKIREQTNVHTLAASVATLACSIFGLVGLKSFAITGVTLGAVQILGAGIVIAHMAQNLEKFKQIFILDKRYYLEPENRMKIAGERAQLVQKIKVSVTEEKVQGHAADFVANLQSKTDRSKSERAAAAEAQSSSPSTLSLKLRGLANRLISRQRDD